MKIPALAIFAISTALLAQGGALAAGEPAKPQEQVESIKLRSGQLPAVSLTPELLYRILVAELAAQNGLYDDAAHGLMLLARDTTDPRLAQRAFQMAMSGRNLALALGSAGLWAQLEPDNPEAVAASLALSASNGQTDGLAQTLARRIQSAEDQDEAIIQAAGIVSRMTDRHLALDVLEKALAGVGQGSALARMALADAAWAASEPARALQESRAALAIEPDSRDAAQRVLEYGLRYDTDRVITETRRFLDAHPQERGLRLQLVSRLTAIAEFDEALGLLAQMRASNPEDFELLYTEAEVNSRARRFERARDLLNQYVAIEQQRRKTVHDAATTAQSDVSDARLLLVQIAEHEGDYPEAIRQLGLIDEPPIKFQARIHQAALYGKMGDLARARELLGALKPADLRERAVISLTLASIYRNAGRTDQALDLLRGADLEMPDTPEIKYDLAMILLNQGRNTEFEELMRRVIEIDPENANAYNSLGYTLVEQNRDLDDARGLLERALELDPESPYILDSVGWYLYRVDDLQGALEYLRRSYDRLQAPDVAAHLGEVLWLLGRHDEARSIWAEGQAAAPDNRLILETMQRLGAH